MINTIKHRLFLTFGGLTFFVCTVFTGVTWLFAAVAEDEVVKHIITTEAEFLLAQYEETSQLLQPRADYMQLFKTEAALPDAIRDGYRDYPHEKEFYAYGDNYHIDEFTTPQGNQFYITLNASKLEGLSSLNSTIWSFLSITSVVVVTIALVLAWVLSNRTAKPLEALSATLANHKFGDSLPNLPKDRQDEIGTLSRAFSNALEQITRLLERERTFTRDVSHELRTPMTLIKNTIQLNRNGTFRKKDIAAIEHASNELEQTVDVLLALARHENLQFSDVRLTPILEACVLKIFSLHPEIEFHVDIQIEDSFNVTGNAYLINLLCQNLINNGFYHSTSSAMKVYRHRNVLTFENALSGDQEKPFYQGLGHGQYLVNRIVDEMHWKIDTKQVDGSYIVNIVTG